MNGLWLMKCVKCMNTISDLQLEVNGKLLSTGISLTVCTTSMSTSIIIVVRVALIHPSFLLDLKYASKYFSADVFLTKWFYILLKKVLVILSLLAMLEQYYLLNLHWTIIKSFRMNFTFLRAKKGKAEKVT